jgi:hypothetical protein
MEEDFTFQFLIRNFLWTKSTTSPKPQAGTSPTCRVRRLTSTINSWVTDTSLLIGRTISNDTDKMTREMTCPATSNLTVHLDESYPTKCSAKSIHLWGRTVQKIFKISWISWIKTWTTVTVGRFITWTILTWTQGTGQARTTSKTNSRMRCSRSGEAPRSRWVDRWAKSRHKTAYDRTWSLRTLWQSTRGSRANCPHQKATCYSKASNCSSPATISQPLSYSKMVNKHSTRISTISTTSHWFTSSSTIMSQVSQNCRRSFQSTRHLRKLFTCLLSSVLSILILCKGR